jgi:hypothetical protein
MKSFITIAIKVVLSVLLLLCLFKMSYGYYQLVHFTGMLGFVLLAYFSYEQKKNVEVIIYVALALLFQPIIKVALGRTIWNMVDAVVGLGLIISIFYKVKIE